MSEVKVTFRHRAALDTRFAPDCFAGSIGAQVPLYRADGSVHEGRLLAAEVIEAGTAVLLTLACSEQVAARLWAGAVPSATNVSIDRGGNRS